MSWACDAEGQESVHEEPVQSPMNISQISENQKAHTGSEASLTLCPQSTAHAYPGLPWDPDALIPVLSWDGHHYERSSALGPCIYKIRPRPSMFELDLIACCTRKGLSLTEILIPLLKGKRVRSCWGHGSYSGIRWPEVARSWWLVAFKPIVPISWFSGSRFEQHPLEYAASKWTKFISHRKPHTNLPLHIPFTPQLGKLSQWTRVGGTCSVLPVPDLAYDMYSLDKYSVWRITYEHHFCTLSETKSQKKTLLIHSYKF